MQENDAKFDTVSEQVAEVERLRAEVAYINRDLERTRAWIEERAGERHLLHSSLGKENRFWGCSRGPCQCAATFLRGFVRYRCKAREAGTAGGNDGQDCDWPFCGCYPEVTAALIAVEESGRFVPREEVEQIKAAEREACARVADEWQLGDVYVARMDAVDLLADVAAAIRARR